MISMARFHRVDPGLIPGRGNNLFFFFVFFIFYSSNKPDIGMGNTVTFYIGALHGTTSGAYLEERNAGMMDKELHASPEAAIASFVRFMPSFYGEYELDEKRKKRLDAVYGDNRERDYSVAAYFERFPLRTEADVQEWVKDFNTPDRTYNFVIVPLILGEDAAKACGVSLP